MATATNQGLTGALAERACAIAWDDLPADVVELTRHCLLDWFGVTLAAAGADPTRILLETLPPPADGSATIVGHGVRHTPLGAALINGTASHALDFDDIHTGSLTHPSVSLLGAALALAEDRDASVADLIAAYVAGYETLCRVAAAIGPEPYDRGFHQTGTVGTFGAAAACAHLLGLDPATTATAFGIAASEAAGTRANFGTMTKPLHAGRACENGLLAALLASRGFSANPRAIEADQGFAALAGGSCDTGAALAAPPSGWHLRDHLFKYHASCFWTHSMLEGVGELAVRAEDVERVEIHVSEIELGTCVIPEPATALEVKFSMAHLCAMALLGRDTTAVTDDDARDEEVVALRRRVELVPDGVAHDPMRVEITSAGERHSVAHDVRTAERDLPRQARRLGDKFRVLASPVLGEAGAERLLEKLLGLEPDRPVRELVPQS